MDSIFKLFSIRPNSHGGGDSIYIQIQTNTEDMIVKAYTILWSMRRLRGMSASMEDLKDIYVKQVRSVLEFAVPTWNSALAEVEKKDIERVQKTASYAYYAWVFITGL